MTELGLLTTAGIMAVVVILLICLAIFGLSLFAEWKFFEKCGEKGWKGIIPLYNSWTLVEISECHWWYFLLIAGNFFITLVSNNTETVGTLFLISGIVNLLSFYATLCVNYNIAKKFNEGLGFAIGMSLVPMIFYLILVFSKKYEFNKNIEVNTWGIYDFENKTSDLKKKKYFCQECGTEMSGNFCPNCGKNKKGE